MSKGDAQLWSLLHEKLDLLRRNGQPRAALRTAETLASLSRRTFGERSAELAQTLVKWSALEVEQGTLAAAEAHLLEAVRILDQLQPPPPALLAPATAQLGLLLSNRGEIASARDLYVRAIEFTVMLEGPETETVATLLNNAALLYQATGDPVEAETRFRWAIAVYEKISDAANLQTATVLHNLGNLLVQLERYGEARQVLEKTMQIRTEMLAREHPTLAQTLGALAVSHHGSGDLDEARQLYDRTLRILQKHLPETSSDYRTIGENLALLLRSMGQTKQAASVLKQVQKHAAAP